MDVISIMTSLGLFPSHANQTSESKTCDSSAPSLPNNYIHSLHSLKLTVRNHPFSGAFAVSFREGNQNLVSHTIYFLKTVILPQLTPELQFFWIFSGAGIVSLFLDG